MKVNEMWNALLNLGISEQTLQIVTAINGYNEETMCDILYTVAGTRDFEDIE